MSTKTKVACLLIAVVIGLVFVVVDIRSSNATARASSHDDGARATEGANTDFDAAIRQNSQQLIDQGRTTFRFDTFGSESYWGDTLKLHRAIEGELALPAPKPPEGSFDKDAAARGKAIFEGKSQVYDLPCASALRRTRLAYAYSC